jgi:macrolide transport system ATP-binding/permease protein
VEDIHEGALNADIWPAVYYAIDQDPTPFVAVVARTSGGSEQAALAALAPAIRAIDPDVVTLSPVMMRHRIEDSPAAYLQRSSTWLVGGFAALALVLGVIGLYGVIAYSVTQRTREIGVRLALGAERRTVYELILGEAGRLVLAGLVLGAVASVASGLLMRTLLFGTEPWDVPTLAGVAVVLAVAALVASFIPARRAASVDPIEALRSE